MRLGQLIVIEGSDGSGKQTQWELLKTYCQKNNIPHEFFDFPQYEKTFFGAMCREFLRGEHGDPANISPYFIALPYALDRWKVSDQIQHALSQQKLVFTNRYVPSNAVYQGAKLPEEKRDACIDWIFQLEYEEFGIPREDLVIYLHVPVEVSQILMKGKKKDKHEENIALLRKTEELYGMLCKRQAHWVCIECADAAGILPKEEIHEKIIATLRDRGVFS
jgi:dTMP kinase